MAGCFILAVLIAEYARAATGVISGPAWQKMVSEQMKLFNEKDAKTMTDGDYILADRIPSSKLTLWAHFESENGRLQHTHCRAQRDGDPGLLFIPVGSCYISGVPGPLADYKYSCVQSGPENIAATLSSTVCAIGSETMCDRIPGSRWCGLPDSIGQSKQCMAEYKKLLGRKERKADGSIPFSQGEPFSGDTVYASFRCAAKRLVLDRCKARYGFVDIVPGEYQANSKRFYVCPKVGPLMSEEDMKNLESRLRAVAKGDPILRQLKPKLPQQFQSKCSKAWETMTDDGDRMYDLDEATITIAIGGRIPKDQQVKGKSKRYPDLVAKFSCDIKTDKLMLEYCVHLEQDYDGKAAEIPTKLSADACRKEDKEKDGAISGFLVEEELGKQSH